MDFKLIINSIILIFFIHIILLNINYNISFGNKKIETFSDKDDSMAFLTNSNNDEDFKKKMLKYVNQTPSLEKETSKVEASNTFLSNNNEPNFESNVADISKFYKVNYDNVTEDKNLNVSEIKNKNEIETKPENSEKRESQVNPDNWSYKNELPMNGGGMNGIIGFDSLESQFAIFNPNKSNSSEFNNIPHNDLRKPIIYEN
jgi:hypothetical protein